MRDSPGIWLKDQPGIDLAQSRTQGRETLLTDTASSGNQPFDLFGTKLIGITPDNGHKLIITVTFIIVVIVLNWSLRAIVTLARRVQLSERIVFWIRQGISLFLAIFTLIRCPSIWFNNPAKLATFMGLVTAGFAFALQKSISAIAGYLVILRGKTFSVGDRITMSVSEAM